MPYIGSNDLEKELQHQINEDFAYNTSMKTVWNSLPARSCAAMPSSSSAYCPMRRASAVTMGSPAATARSTSCGCVGWEAGGGHDESGRSGAESTWG